MVQKKNGGKHFFSLLNFLDISLFFLYLLSPSVSLSLSLARARSVSFYLSLSSLSLSFSLSLYLTLSLYLSISESLSFSLSLSHTHSFFVPMSLSVSVYFRYIVLLDTLVCFAGNRQKGKQECERRRFDQYSAIRESVAAACMIAITKSTYLQISLYI